MPNPPQLLNDDGTASMATALLMSHHGLRRDLARFARALRHLTDGDGSKVAALQEEWRSYHATLHGHHEAEDKGLFPSLRSQHPDLAPVIDRLGADHTRIDPLLATGDAAFADLSAKSNAAATIVAQLSDLLDAHLATEEASVIHFLRGAKQFPPPASDAEADMYAQGFAWASHGVAENVLARVDEMLPPILTSRLGAARTAFEQRCLRVWGPTPTGASHTAIPDWLVGPFA